MMFHKILLATDGSESGRVATAFAVELSEAFGASVETCSLEGTSRTTWAGRDHEVVKRIADRTGQTQADVIVLGVDRRRLGRHRAARGLRDQLARRTHLPVMMAPTRTSAEARDMGQVRSSGLSVAAGRGRLEHV